MIIRYYVLVFLSILFCNQTLSQCNRTVKVVFTHINYKAGCDFTDGGGIDPTLDLYDQAGNRIYNSHYGDQSQVSGPQDNVPIDFNITVNPCGNFSNSFTLGIFPVEMETVDVTADTYEKDSNFINDQCSPYNFILDDNYASGNHTFDFTQTTGVIDVGGCMTYNYELEITLAGTLAIEVLGPICPSDTIYIANNTYHFTNRTESLMIPGLPNSCDTLYNIDLAFFDPIQFSIIGQQHICPGDQTTLRLDTAFDEYLWDEGSITDSLTIDTAGSYAITVTSADGCTKEAEIMIEEYPSQMVIIQGEDKICEGTSTELTLNNTGNAIIWSNGMTTPSITITEGGNYTAVVTDNNGCRSSDEFLVQEFALPAPTISGPDSFCAGDSTTLQVDQNFTLYQWNTNNDKDAISVDTEGTFSVTVTDTNGCTASTMIAVSSSTPPAPTIEGSTIICQGSPITLSLGENYENYIWNTGEDTKEISTSSAGDYTVTVTDLNGCSSSTTLSVTEQDQLNPTIVGELEICEGEINTLSVMEDQVEYLWNDGTTEQERIASTAGIYSVTITDSNGCTGEAQAAIIVIPQIVEERDSITCYPNVVGIEILEIPNSAGCIDLIQYNITLDSEQRCDIDFLSNTVGETCAGANDGSFTMNIQDAQFPVLVELFDSENNLLISGAQTEAGVFTIPNLSEGNYDLVLSADNYQTETIEISIQTKQLSVELPSSITTNVGESFILTADLDTTLYTTFYWSLGGISLCPDNCNSVTITADTTASYTFLAQLADLDCEFIGSTVVTITPAQELYIPTAFAPGSNGPNEKFEILGPGISLIKAFNIYDRWGNLVYQTDGSDPSWDGTSKGAELNSGVYLYLLELEDGQDSKLQNYRTGSITLIR